MRIAQSFTACDAYAAHHATGKASAQCARILGFIASRGGSWSIGEVAHALGLQKSTVSARIWECVHETFDLEEAAKRKDRISGITVRTVRIPLVGQMGLF